VRLKAPDLWAGLALMALAGGYYMAALGIHQSLLSDVVGAAGIPKLLAALLGLCGVLMVVRSQLGQAMRITPRVPARSIGLLALFAAHILLLPIVGYPVALAALVASVALLAGERATPRLAIISIAAGAGFWWVFAGLLGISMPAGLLAGWI
jgi:putative tricarboxylic transport membrane protein